MSKAIFCDRCEILYPAHKMVKAELKIFAFNEASEPTESRRFEKDLCPKCVDEIHEITAVLFDEDKVICI